MGWAQDSDSPPAEAAEAAPAEESEPASAKESGSEASNTPDAPPPGPPIFSLTELNVLARIGPFVRGGVTDNEDGDAANLVLTFQHLSTWSHGTNFFFLDVDSNAFKNLGEGTGFYLEFSPEFNLPIAPIGPIVNIALSPQLNVGKSPGLPSFDITTAILGGAVLYWDVGAGNTFATHFLVRKQHNFDVGGQLTLVWFIPFELGPVPTFFRGFFDFWVQTPSFPEATTELTLLTQPQILFSLAPLGLGKLQLGFEFQISHDFPFRQAYVDRFDGGEDRSTRFDFAISPMLNWVFF